MKRHFFEFPNRHTNLHYHRFLLLIGITCIWMQPTLAQDATVKEASEAKQLFNGTSLEGWDGDPRLWSVKDGVIRGETTRENKTNGNTFLIWQDGTPKNFELRLSFRCTNQNNSGIQYRSKHITTDSVANQWLVRGYQHELRNEHDFPDVSGFIYGEGIGRGRICLVGEQAIIEAEEKKITKTLIDQEGFKKLFKLDDWNEVVIRAEGSHIQHFMNGTLILDFTDSPAQTLDEGVIALQLHAGTPMWAEFKDIRLTELD